MKKFLILAAVAVLTASCATGANDAVQKSLTNINEELVVVQKSITDMQTSIEDLQAGAARSGADLAANTDAIAELRSELAYLNNEIMVMKGNSSKSALTPIQEEPRSNPGMSSILEIDMPKQNQGEDQQIIIIDDASSSKNSVYSYAIELTNQGKYSEARGKFQEFLGQYPKDKLAGNAQYWIGETYYSTNDMNNAIQSFKNVLSKYPKSAKVPDAMLKIGYAYEKTGDKTQAVSTLKDLLNKYPKSRAAKLATEKLQSWGA